LEEQGYIEIRIENEDNSMSPSKVDISDIKEVITDIETFLYPSKSEKQNRPHISYRIEKGSAKHKFQLSITSVILFNGFIQEIKARDNIDFLNYKRQSIISEFQNKAFFNNLKIEFSSSLSNNESLIIDKNSNFQVTTPNFYESEFYLYGEIYQEGGKTPNVHISTKEYGNLTISATKQQIMEGDKKTYKLYGVKVKGKKNLENGKLFDLKLKEYILYQPVFDRKLLSEVIRKASANLSKIKDVDKWVADLKTDLA